MNTAAELTHHDVEAAEHAILALAALSQAAMRSGQSVLLSDEIVLTKQYIALESWRFAERLQVKWSLPENLPALYIPYLTLHPLVENAVCHGVEPSQSGATISIERLCTHHNIETDFYPLYQDFFPHQTHHTHTRLYILHSDSTVGYITMFI